MFTLPSASFSANEEAESRSRGVAVSRVAALAFSFQNFPVFLQRLIKAGIKGFLPPLSPGVSRPPPLFLAAALAAGRFKLISLKTLEFLADVRQTSKMA